MNYRFVRYGIGPEVWTNWTLDQTDLFWEEEGRRAEERRKAIEDQTLRAKRAKADPLIRFTLPIGGE